MLARWRTDIENRTDLTNEEREEVLQWISAIENTDFTGIDSEKLSFPVLENEEIELIDPNCSED